MSVITGKDAYVNGVPCTTSWAAQHVANIQRYAASCTHGGTSVVEGNHNWTGSMSGLGAEPPVKPGEELAFLGIIDNTNTDEKDLSGTVKISTVNINFPIVGGGPITWTAAFGAKGQLVDGSTGGVDTSEKLAQSAKMSIVKIDPVSLALVPDVLQSLSIAMRTPQKDFVSGGAMDRETGNLEVDISFALMNRNLFVTGYQPNERYTVEIHPDSSAPTVKWVFDQVVFGGQTNFQVNVATQALVGYTVTGMWSATSSPTLDNLGSIIAPSGAYWFGSA